MSRFPLVLSNLIHPRLKLGVIGRRSEILGLDRCSVVEIRSIRLDSRLSNIVDQCISGESCIGIRWVHNWWVRWVDSGLGVSIADRISTFVETPRGATRSLSRTVSVHTVIAGRTAPLRCAYAHWVCVGSHIVWRYILFLVLEDNLVGVILDVVLLWFNNWSGFVSQVLILVFLSYFFDFVDGFISLVLFGVFIFVVDIILGLADNTVYCLIHYCGIDLLRGLHICFRDWLKSKILSSWDVRKITNWSPNHVVRVIRYSSRWDRNALNTNSLGNNRSLSREKTR